LCTALTSNWRCSSREVWASTHRNVAGKATLSRAICSSVATTVG
jgi:hypothetical protein